MSTSENRPAGGGSVLVAMQVNITNLFNASPSTSPNTNTFRTTAALGETVGDVDPKQVNKTWTGCLDETSSTDGNATADSTGG